jgi:hypothetical protein
MFAFEIRIVKSQISGMLNAAGSKTSHALLGDQHTKRNIMVKRWQRFYDLSFKCQPAGSTDEIVLSQEPVIKPQPATDAEPRIGKSQAGNDHKINHVNWNRLTGDGFADAGTSAGEPGLQAGDFDREHSLLIPGNFRGYDRFTRLPTTQSQRGGVYFVRGGKKNHHDAGILKINASGDPTAGEQ